MASVIILSILMLSVIMLSVVTLNVAAPAWESQNKILDFLINLENLGYAEMIRSWLHLSLNQLFTKLTKVIEKSSSLAAASGETKFHTNHSYDFGRTLLPCSSPT
jgi:hypothetical protein